ncbi:MAG: hypothetical protein ACOCXZ_03370 [Chloroflexota bacterium]
MRVIKFFVALMMVLLVALPVLAQDDNGTAEPEVPDEWARFEREPVSMGFPSTWSSSTDANGELLAIDPETGMRVTFTLVTFPEAYTPEEAEADVLDALEPSTVLESQILSFPAGPVVRVEQQQVVEGLTVRLVQYFFTVGVNAVLAQGIFLEDDVTEQDILLSLDLLDTIAATVRIDDEQAEPWPLFVNVAETVTVRAPEPWFALESSNDSTLVLGEDEAGAVVVATLVDLDEVIDVSVLEDSMRESLLERDAEILSLELVNRPFGDALRALMEVPVPETDTMRQEVQYYTMLDTNLVIASGSVPLELWEDQEAELIRILDTLMQPEADE